MTARLKAAGAVLVGKTNLHEFAFGTTSEDSAFGAVRNPHDTSRSAGGSSGGSAASVATGMSIATIGTDTGGSIRIPSAACGLVGFKPAFGEVPCDGVVPLSATFDHVGPLARTVADAAAMLRVLARVGAAAAHRQMATTLRLGRLRGYFEARLEPAVSARYESALESIANAGVAPIGRDPAARLGHRGHLPANRARRRRPRITRRRCEQCPERYSPPVRLRLEMGRYILAEDYLRARAGQEVLEARGRPGPGRRRRAGAARHADCGAAAGRRNRGSSAIVAEPVRAADAANDAAVQRVGHPAIVLPCGMTPSSLPVSLQLVGMRSVGLLDVAAGVEAMLRSDAAKS